jgi:hypothetical protein
MTIPSTSLFNMNANDVLDAAYARLGGEQETGYNARSARRALQLLQASWANRGVNLFLMDQEILTLQTNVVTYTMPADTLDVLDVVTRDQNGNDLTCSRIGRTTYFNLPNKTTTYGRPYQFFLNRTVSDVEMTVYPVPDAGTWSMPYWRIRKPKDVTALTDNLDMPYLFLPAAVSGLAYYMALERPDIVLDHRQMLKAQYEADYAEAAESFRDRAPLRIYPNLACYQDGR